LYRKYAPTVPNHHLPCFQRSSCEPVRFSGRTLVSHLVYFRHTLPRLCALGVRNPSALRIHSESVSWSFLRLAIPSRALNFVLYKRPNLSHTSSLHSILKSTGHQSNSRPASRAFSPTTTLSWGDFSTWMSFWLCWYRLRVWPWNFRSECNSPTFWPAEPGSDLSCNKRSTTRSAVSHLLIWLYITSL
jgi:hypothetical protein